MFRATSISEEEVSTSSDEDMDELEGVLNKSTIESDEKDESSEEFKSKLAAEAARDEEEIEQAQKKMQRNIEQRFN